MPVLCTRNYVNISKGKIDMMFKILFSHGALIGGTNPWNIVTHHHGVILRAEWDESALTLDVSIMGRNWYVPHEAIWKNIDELVCQK